MLIDRWTTKEFQWLAAIAILLLGLVFLSVQATTDRGGHSRLGPPLAGDFSGFYAAGRAARSEGLMAPYDLEIQNQHYHEAFPAIAPSSRFPFIYPPFITAILRPLSALPYRTAAMIWMLGLLGFMGLGLWFIRQSVPEWPAGHWVRVMALILAFEPVLFESILGGQLSPIAFAVVAGIVWSESRQRAFLSGLCLAVLCYKPTLLVLVLPMLFIGRRWRTLAGFGCGAGVLGLITIALVGVEGTIEYVHRLLAFASLTRSQGLELRTWKYVDITACLRLLLGETALARWLSLAIAVPGILWLARVWFGSRQLTLQGQRALWAATWLATLVLNGYVAIYDTILAIPPLFAVWMTGAMASPAEPSNPSQARRILALLWLLPWLATPISQATGLQLLTPAIGGLAASLVLTAEHNMKGEQNS